MWTVTSRKALDFRAADTRQHHDEKPQVTLLAIDREINRAAKKSSVVTTLLLVR